MSEYETNPQRGAGEPQDARPESEPASPWSAPRPESAQAESAPADSTGAESARAAGSEAPAQSLSGPLSPDPDATGDRPAQDTTSSSPAAPGSPSTPGQQPDAEPATRPLPPVPAGPPPAAGQHWHPGQSHQPGWPGNGGYGTSAGLRQPGAHAAPHPGMHAAPHPGPGPQPAGPYPGQPPPYGGQPASGAGYPPPPWASQHAQPAQAGAPRRPGRVAKVVAAGAAAAVLMLGSGLLGGWVATRDDNNTTTPAAAPRPAAAAPVIDRSSLAGIAAAVQPSVVSISTGTGEGSGVVLTADGYILTNNHVVASARGDQVNVAFTDGKDVTAKIVGADELTDLAVVKADGVSGLRPATFGDSDSMRVGDTVLALGSPLGLQGSVTAGIVSALNRTIQVGGEQGSPLEPPAARKSMSGLLQTDAPINPGNSGGALVNTSGQVIGINSAIATSGGSQGNIGVGFAIPSNKAKAVADQLMKGEKVSHPVIGVNVTDAETGGALIGDVQSGGPADKAGLEKGDIVTKIGDKQINDSNDLVSAVQTGKVGDKLTFTYVRNGNQRTTTVTLGEAS